MLDCTHDRMPVLWIGRNDTIGVVAEQKVPAREAALELSEVSAHAGLGLPGLLGVRLRERPFLLAQVGMEYGHKYGGADFELFARISEKNHAHSTLNPLAAYTKRFTVEEIYHVRVLSVATQHRKGQLKRNKYGYWKSAGYEEEMQ